DDTPNVARDAVIIVNGQKMTGPNSMAQRRGARWLLPVLGLARALGDIAAISSATRTISVRRQTGASAEFDANLGAVRENGSMILTVSNAAEIVFPPNPDEILLPIEIVTALFDASTRFDSVARAVIVNRGGPLAETVRVGAEHSFAEFYQ